MTITVVFDPPVPADSPAVFNQKAFATLGQLNAWSDQVNLTAEAVNADQVSANTQATAATNAATTATTKATEAAASATTASTQATAATSAATTATTKATEAAASATTASTQATAAASAATTATTKATEAAASATTASTQATAAASAATTATTKATEAAASATTASTQATAAASAATTATTKATEAAASATTAQTAAAAAANASRLDIGLVVTGTPGSEVQAAITGVAGAQLLNLSIPAGDIGETGVGIASIARTAGTGAQGEIDTYTVTLTNAATYSFTVYNGVDGAGSGDMSKAIYDADNDGVVDAAESVPWSGITGKPAVFEPDAHDHSSISGNAASASALQNARLINGVPFNGSQNITINAVDATARIAASEKGAALGVATLGADGKLIPAQVPSMAITDTFVVSSQASMLSLVAEIGDVCVRTDLSKSFILKTAGAGTLGNWAELLSPTGNVGTVTSVGLSLPAELSVSGAPITSAGTLIASWAAQAQAKVFAAPAGSGGTPTFRALVPSDIPALSYVSSVNMTVPTGLTVTGLPITSSGTIAIALAAGYSIPTTANQSSWDAAYNWGNHASAGYYSANGVLGTPASGDLRNCTIDGSHKPGYRNVPQDTSSANYTFALTDVGRHRLHPSADTTGRTFTIPANSAVAFDIGDILMAINQNGAGNITIAITTDTMRLAGDGATGNRTLAPNGIFTAIKVAPTEWLCSGIGVS